MKIKNGVDFTLCLTDRGDVYSWGKNNLGQLGIGTMDDDYHMPTKIGFILDIPIRYISAGYNHAYAIDFDYNVYIWGFNDHRQLGYGDKVDRPTIIECLTEKRVEKIYCRYTHTIALTQTGEVYSWGSNDNGILGIGTNDIIYIGVPTRINFPNGTIIKKIYTGEYHTFAIDTSSKIYSWGDNFYYTLCNGNNIVQNLPSVANMLGCINVNKIICLYDVTIILADNKLYSIGSGYCKELCIKETKNINQIGEGVEKVWGNQSTVFCKMCNGDFYAWGKNHRGQLGVGNTENQNIPVKINIAENIKGIYYNYCKTYAVATNGKIYTWGTNELVNNKLLLIPTIITYFMDNGIDIKYVNRTKSARKKYC